LSADSIVPDPANPQSFNRYTYVLNRPINFFDPTGHKECGSDDECTDTLPYDPGYYPLPKLSDIQAIEPVFFGLPIEGATWFNGFGANSYSARFANPSSLEFNGTYTNSAGIHPGLDFIKSYDPDCSECNTVYANVSGVVVSRYPGDAGPPNVVIRLDNGMYVIYGHVEGTLAEGTRVEPGDSIGVLQDQREFDEQGNLKRDNTHVHLAIRKPTSVGEQVYNPLYFWADPSEVSDINWGYPSGQDPYRISSYLYGSNFSYWTDPGWKFGLTIN
jgi:hypothetical protein